MANDNKSNSFETKANLNDPKSDSKEFKNNLKQRDDGKIFYGDSTEVNPVGYSDYNDFIKNKKSKQDLKGFDSQYNDFVDYIMKITHGIWEEKGIGIIYDTYHNNVTMHTGSSNITGIQSVIAGTLQTLHAFPDRRLIGQNVVWSNFDKEGYLSSHRIMSTATNLGDSEFGPATGRKITFRTAVDCAVHNNRIHEEWLVRDNLWIVKQLGFDSHEVAKKMAKATSSKTPALQTRYGLCESMEGQFFPEKYTAKDSSIGEFMLEMTSRIYQYKMLNDVKKYYADNATVHYICDKDLVGFDQIQGMLISLLSSFPNASYNVDRVTCNQRGKIEENDWNVSLRWRLRGIHEGRGYFGAPSGKPIEILGINHFHVRDNKVVEEWVTFDGLDVLRQIYLQTDDEYYKEEEKEI
ncbi:ester cyclase [Clostridium oceanicum]|uniref:Polyketide cyclase n=1 Tax=Clostridium oceanicum TaxID=1543 RepID=A0ABN1JAQ8_9CLOT